jgi:hypothetical protein
MYFLFSLFFIFLALCALYGAYKLLIKQHWLIAWIKGTAGVLLILLAVCLSLIAWDITSYKSLDLNKEIASVSMVKNGNQDFTVEVSTPDGKKNKFDLKGDLWQLDARILKWGGPFAFFGLKPGYRLERISGRYLSLEDERSKARTVFALDGGSALDFWSFLKKNTWLPWMKPQYGSAAYLPLDNGAIYTVLLSQSGLVARPVNDVAMKAVQSWQ